MISLGKDAVSREKNCEGELHLTVCSARKLWLECLWMSLESGIYQDLKYSQIALLARTTPKPRKMAMTVPTPGAVAITTILPTYTIILT